MTDLKRSMQKLKLTGVQVEFLKWARLQHRDWAIQFPPNHPPQYSVRRDDGTAFVVDLRDMPEGVFCNVGDEWQITLLGSRVAEVFIEAELGNA